MKVILSVPDEGYSERTWWRLFWAYLMKVILSVPDEGYSERTWWRLFWAYLMKVILSVPDEDYSRNVSCALHLISTLLLLLLYKMNKSFNVLKKWGWVQLVYHVSCRYLAIPEHEYSRKPTSTQELLLDLNDIFPSTKY
jgi:hypothetical protein